MANHDQQHEHKYLDDQSEQSERERDYEEYLQSQTFAAPPSHHKQHGNVVNMPVALAPAPAPIPVDKNQAVYIDNGIKYTDAHHTKKLPPEAVDYFIDDFLPAGECGDFFGAPGDGKTTIITNLAVAVSSGKGNWFGTKCKSGQVIMLGGERGNINAFRRDLERAGKGVDIDPEMMMLMQAPDGKNALWKWSKQIEEWILTDWGQRVTNELMRMQPALLVLDTTMSVATGCNPMDVAQQYALGETLQSWRRKIHIQMTTINASHTNQVSSLEDASRRLHYLSRSGGNGFPGSIRWIAGVTRLQGESMRGRHTHAGDSIVEKLGLSKRANTDCLIALGASKHNEIARPKWNNDYPAIFNLRPDGELVLVFSGQEVKAAALEYKAPRGGLSEEESREVKERRNAKPKF